MAERTQGLAYGGLGSLRLLVQELGLAEAIDRRLHLLKIHLPYHESDHVLNLAFNALCDGDCLEDLELRRNDEVYLNALGARRIPDPTTAGDFCRRFRPHHVRVLLDVYHEARLKVWARQPAEFFDEARVDMDGVLVPTGGECKAGMDISYKGTWGYHPLMVSLANTGEVLAIVNRSGNRPSHEGAAEEVDRVLEVCFAGGFRKVLLAWRHRLHADQASRPLERRPAGAVHIRHGLPAELARFGRRFAGHSLEKAAAAAALPVQTTPRRRRGNVKERIVREREFKNMRLVGEEVAEFDYRPTACQQDLSHGRGEKVPGSEQGPSGVVRGLPLLLLHHQRPGTFGGGSGVPGQRSLRSRELAWPNSRAAVRALHAPVDNLVSNWAYMVMTSSGLELESLVGLVSCPRGVGRHAESQREEKRRVLRMEFKTFRNAFVRLPCQIVRVRPAFDLPLC